MTTIACDLKQMAADSRVTLDGLAMGGFSSVKIVSTERAIYGMAGENCDGQTIALEWLSAGGTVATAGARPEPPVEADWIIVELTRGGIALYNTQLEREAVLNQFITAGSGGKVAAYCMKFLGMSPVEAVREACKVDPYSGHPIYHAMLRDRVVRPWRPKGKRK